MTDLVQGKPSAHGSRWAVLGVLVVVAALLAAAIGLIAGPRLSSTTASNGQDMSALNRGLVGAGFGNTSPEQSARGQGPVADIAVNLVASAFSFTPSGYTAQVKKAESLMTAGMRQKYVASLNSQKTQQVAAAGVTMTTSLLHMNDDPSQAGLVGVISVTSTSGEFLMFVKQLSTLPGSKSQQANAELLDVKVQKIGDTWLLSDITPV